MSTQETRLAEIAEAIRTKENSSAPIPAKEFASRILALENSSVPEGLRTISLTAEPAEGGVVSGGGLASEGMTVTVNAEPGDAYNFNGWQENGQTVSESEAYTFTVTGDRALAAVFEVAKQSRLPDGYTEVRYIESSGTQYINTGLKPTSTIKLTLDVEPLIAATSTQKNFYGASYAPSISGTTKYYFILGWAESGVRVTTGSTTSSATYKILSSDITPRRMTIVVDCPNKKAFVEGESEVALTNVSASTSMVAIRLLANGTGGSPITAKLYSSTIYTSGELARDFVPCINPTGAVGLYDLVTETFYANAGTGTFTAGPKV